jgi:DNA-binding NarL/FixJ family response regulator
VNILLIDDHPLIREGIASMLARLSEACHLEEAIDCRSALDALDRCGRPDLVLLDLCLPDCSGFAGLDALREACPQAPIVVLSARDDRETILEALDRGAMGFIPKTMSPDLIWAALRLVLAGGIYVPQTLVGGVDKRSPVRSQAVARPPRASALDALDLTERQVDTLRMLVQGLPNKLIARELGVAEATVKVYISAALRAMNVTSRTQAVIWLSRNDIRFDGSAGTRPLSQ